jgi:hypothetical protein
VIVFGHIRKVFKNLGKSEMAESEVAPANKQMCKAKRQDDLIEVD